MQTLQLLTILLTTLYATAGFLEAYEDSSSNILAQIKKYKELADNTNLRSNSWVAAYNPDFDYSESRLKKLTNLQLNAMEYLSLSASASQTSRLLQNAQNANPLPENFTAQAKWSNCPSITTIQDQSGCGSCWAVASATAISDRICIASANNQNQTVVSYEDLVGCCATCGYGCQGGSVVMAYNYWTTIGLVSGGGYNATNVCKPYSFPPCSNPAYYAVCSRINFVTPTCKATCADGSAVGSRRIRGKRLYPVAANEQAIMTELFNNGPVTAAMLVYQDFFNYRTGVYKQATGGLAGAHAIKIFGYGVENGVKYWLVANSWGSGWGINGTFKILRGSNHMQIESYVVAGEAYAS